MFGYFMPREVKFFELFNAHAKEIVRGADVLVAVVASLSQSPEVAAAHAITLDAIEERADKIADETLAMLHATFITPLDRDEIHQLITHLDDVLDTMQDASGTVTTYDVRRATPEAIRFAEIIRASVQGVEKAVSLLNNMKNGPAILDACKEISSLESDADRLLRDAMSKLFREEADVRELIKLKAMYELLETVTDCCKRVATTLESIVLENS
jgi:predicted phosphate transport protein (TIGR00153 family)